MAESKDFSAEAGSAKVIGTVSSSDIAEPVAPPLGLRAMGPRITFHFVGEWDAETSYVLYDVVRGVDGTSYIANKINIAKGVNPENDNEAHWVKWNDPNAQVELLQQTVNGFAGRITEVETEAANAANAAADAKAASASNAAAIAAEATRAKAAEAANADAIEANADAIEANTAAIKANTAAINSNAGRKYGFAVVMMPPFNTEASIKKRVDLANKAGASNINVCVYIDNDAMTPKALCDYAISYAKSVGMEVSLKVHGYTSSPSAYGNLVSNYLDSLSYAPNTVFIYNEPGKDYITANESTMLSTISAIKAKGYTVGIPLNYPSMQVADKLIARCDIVGINLYPSLGYSLTYSVESMMKALSDSFNAMTAGITKNIWITEAGILPRKCFLFAPEVYNPDDGYPTDSSIGREVDYNVATSYYRAAIKALSNCCDNLLLWYGETSLVDDNAEFVRSA